MTLAELVARWQRATIASEYEAGIVAAVCVANLLALHDTPAVMQAWLNTDDTVQDEWGRGFAHVRQLLRGETQ